MKNWYWKPSESISGHCISGTNSFCTGQVSSVTHHTYSRGIRIESRRAYQQQYQTTRRHIRGDHNVNTHRCDNFKYHAVIMSIWMAVFCKTSLWTFEDKKCQEFLEQSNKRSLLKKASHWIRWCMGKRSRLVIGTFWIPILTGIYQSL
jgi:hypothetical protein